MVYFHHVFCFEHPLKKSAVFLNVYLTCCLEESMLNWLRHMNVSRGWALMVRKSSWRGMCLKHSYCLLDILTICASLKHSSEGLKPLHTCRQLSLLYVKTKLENNGNQIVVILSSIHYESLSRNVKSVFKDDFRLKNNNQK